MLDYFSYHSSENTISIFCFLVKTGSNLKENATRICNILRAINKALYLTNDLIPEQKERKEKK